MLNDSILLREVLPNFGMSLDDLITSQGLFFLKQDEELKINALPEEQKISYLKKTVSHEILLCSLFVTNLCQTLHENENQFRAIDAYHIGLVDEIFGMSHIFPSFTSLLSPDPQNS